MKTTFNEVIMETVRYDKTNNEFIHVDNVIVRRQPAFKHLLHLGLDDEERKDYLIFIPESMREERKESEKFFALLDENNKAMAYSSNKELLEILHKSFFPKTKID